MFPSLRAQGNVMSNNVFATMCPNRRTRFSGFHDFFECERNHGNQTFPKGIFREPIEGGVYFEALFYKKTFQSGLDRS